MAGFCYKSKITELEAISVGSDVVGFTLTVRCDSPYAYLLPTTDLIECSRSTSYNYHNRSNLNDYYCPTLSITAKAPSLSIINHSDGGGRSFTLTGLTAGVPITVDSQNEILASSDGTNLYEHCNLQFPRFVRGVNHLDISGACSIKIRNEFPMLIGT